MEAFVENQKREYDFSDKIPSEILTDDELEHFEEVMQLRNSAVDAGSIDLGLAVKAVVPELDALFA